MGQIKNIKLHIVTDIKVKANKSLKNKQDVVFESCFHVGPCGTTNTNNCSTSTTLHHHAGEGSERPLMGSIWCGASTCRLQHAIPNGQHRTSPCLVVFVEFRWDCPPIRTDTFCCRKPRRRRLIVV